MILFGDIFKDLLFFCQARNNPDREAMILRQVNSDYRSICKRESWGDLREVATIEWDGDPVQLPADVNGIDMVWDDDNYINFLERNYSAAEYPEHSFRYYTYPVGSTLAEVDDAQFGQDQTRFISSDLQATGATVTGEYFYVEGDSQLYKVTSVNGNEFDFTPAYKGKTAQQLNVVVRPRNTMMLQLIGPADAELPTTEVKFHYNRMPDYLRDPEDLVMLPTAEVLLTLSLSHLPMSKKMRPVTQTEVDREYGRALQCNPDKPRPRLVKGVHGRDMRMGPGMYRSRGEKYTTGHDSVRCRWQLNRT